MYGHWQLHSGLETFKCHMCNGIGQRIRPQDGCVFPHPFLLSFYQTLTNVLVEQKMQKMSR